MSARREHEALGAHIAKPNAVELSRRNRESRLNQAVMFYEDRPDPLPEVGAWFEKNPEPKLVVVSGGVTYSVVLEEEV